MPEREEMQNYLTEKLCKPQFKKKVTQLEHCNWISIQNESC